MNEANGCLGCSEEVDERISWDCKQCLGTPALLICPSHQCPESRPGRGEAGACAQVSGTGSPPWGQPAGHTGSHKGQEELVAMSAAPLPSPTHCPMAVSKMQCRLVVCGKDMRGERVRTGASCCHSHAGSAIIPVTGRPARLGSLQSSLQDHSQSVDMGLCPTPALQR